MLTPFEALRQKNKRRAKTTKGRESDTLARLAAFSSSLKTSKSDRADADAPPAAPAMDWLDGDDDDDDDADADAGARARRAPRPPPAARPRGRAQRTVVVHNRAEAGMLKRAVEQASSATSDMTEEEQCAADYHRKRAQQVRAARLCGNLPRDDNITLQGQRGELRRLARRLRRHALAQAPGAREAKLDEGARLVVALVDAKQPVDGGRDVAVRVESCPELLARLVHCDWRGRRRDRGRRWRRERCVLPERCALQRSASRCALQRRERCSALQQQAQQGSRHGVHPRGCKRDERFGAWDHYLCAVSYTHLTLPTILLV